MRVSSALCVLVIFQNGQQRMGRKRRTELQTRGLQDNHKLLSHCTGRLNIGLSVNSVYGHSAGVDGWIVKGLYIILYLIAVKTLPPSSHLVGKLYKTCLGVWLSLVHVCLLFVFCMMSTYSLLHLYSKHLPIFFLSQMSQKLFWTNP